MAKTIIRIKPKKDLLKKFNVSNVHLKEVKIYQRQQKFELFCELEDPRDLKEVEIVENKLREAFKDKFDNFVEFKRENLTDEEVKIVVEFAINKLKRGNSACKSFMNLYKIFVDEKSIVIGLQDEGALETLNNSKVNMKLENLISKYGLKNRTIKLSTGELKEEIKKLEETVEEKSREESQKVKEELLEKNRQAESKPKERASKKNEG